MKPSLKSPLSLALAVIYLLWPLDLIPDILGPLGRIDDLLVLSLVLWQSYVRLRPPQGRKASQSNPPESSAKPPSIDPYALFNLPHNASRDEIEARYKELALQYHPDRVAHLGEELRTLAHEKMVHIQQAYESLIKSASAA